MWFHLIIFKTFLHHLSSHLKSKSTHNFTVCICTCIYSSKQQYHNYHRPSKERQTDIKVIWHHNGLCLGCVPMCNIQKVMERKLFHLKREVNTLNEQQQSCLRSAVPLLQDTRNLSAVHKRSHTSMGLLWILLILFVDLFSFNWNVHFCFSLYGHYQHNRFIGIFTFVYVLVAWLQKKNHVRQYWEYMWYTQTQIHYIHI